MCCLSLVLLLRGGDPFVVLHSLWLIGCNRFQILAGFCILSDIFASLGFDNGSLESFDGKDGGRIANVAESFKFSSPWTKLAN